MQVRGDYEEDGYAFVEGIIPPEVGKAFLTQMRNDFRQSRVSMQSMQRNSEILRQPALEVYGYQYSPMIQFLWGMTPVVSQLVGKDLLPSYNYFRVYQQGDFCYVHSDRPSCEHSLSLTLDYSDGETWDFEIGKEPIDKVQPTAKDFGEAPFATLGMRPGDAVLYKGVQRRHGRVKPNPNRWSAHMFLHWVDREGPYKHFAFDKRNVIDDTLDFTFA